MENLKELGLKPKDRLKVQNWLNRWMQHFKRMANGNRETVERYDLENLDFFYFTDCRDILSKNPESKGVEDQEAIKRRKKAIEYKLLFEYLLGNKLGKKRPCSHCGNEDRIIDSLGDGTGHFLFCPKCGMTTVVTYPIGYETCINRIQGILQQKYKTDFTKFLPLQKEKKHKCCGKCRNKYSARINDVPNGENPRLKKIKNKTNRNGP